MPPDVDQQTLPLFMRRAAALAEIEAEETPRPIEFERIFYFALRTPGSAWPTDQNGNLPKYLKGDRYSLSTAEFLNWLAAVHGILCADCGGHYYPNCTTQPKKCSRRNRRGKVYLRASTLAEPTRTTRIAVPEPDSFIADLHRPLLKKIRRNRKPRQMPSLMPTAPPLDPVA